MLNENTNVLVTGATGLIGGELVPELARAGAGRIACLIRPKAGTPVHQRLQERLRKSSLQLEPVLADRIEAVHGDVAIAGFGLGERDCRRVTEEVNLIIHCASELSFIRDAHCRRTNIAGMENLIELTRACRRKPLVVHLGTVASCGAVAHKCLAEADGSDPQAVHHNEYTRTKAIAEQILRDSGLPALILRPSITLSAGLAARRFARAIVWFVPLLREFDAMPIDPAARVDVVPVSYVVQSIVRLLQKPSLRHDCYNLSAGAQHAMICERVSRFLDGFYERPEPLKLVPSAEWTRAHHRQYVGTPQRRKLFSMVKYYLPFLNMDVVYDNSRLRTELGDATPAITPITAYMGDLLNLIGEPDVAGSSLRR